MIYLNKELNTIKVPKYEINPDVSEYTLTLVNIMTNEEINIDVIDSSVDNIYFTFEINAENLTTGEYKYKVNGTITNGLLVVGEYRIEHKEYQTQTEIKTYEYDG